jgi:hypothetical protein
LQDLVEVHFPEAEKIRVVLNNLNTHSSASFNEAFTPQLVRYLTKKLEFHYMAEYSSWLNMSEVEISVLTELYLDCRLGSQVIAASEVGAWESERNAAWATIDWRFTIPNARDRLKKLYPVREEQRLTIALQRFDKLTVRFGLECCSIRANFSRTRR